MTFLIFSSDSKIILCILTRHIINILSYSVQALWKDDEVKRRCTTRGPTGTQLLYDNEFQSQKETNFLTHQGLEVRQAAKFIAIFL